MGWTVEHILKFDIEKKLWGNGFAHIGFHGKNGEQYMVNHAISTVGCLEDKEFFKWTVGPTQLPESRRHTMINWGVPNSGCLSPDGSLLVTTENELKIYKISPNKGEINEFIKARKFGFKNNIAGMCDLDGNIWVCGIKDFKICEFSPGGELLRTVGDGTPGFQQGTVSFEKARFNWIYCLACGPDGNIYALDSLNYTVRKLDLESETVITIVGSGKSGYSGDGGDPTQATLGSSTRAYNGFDGPWYMVIDESGNIYIADSQNFVIRMVDKTKNIISTIAGANPVHRGKRVNPDETDPLKLNLPYICGLDYYDKRLYIAEWRGDLVVLRYNDGPAGE